MSEEKKPREVSQSMPQLAPVRREEKDTQKAESKPLHSFHDWASI